MKPISAIVIAIIIFSYTAHSQDSLLHSNSPQDKPWMPKDSSEYVKFLRFREVFTTLAKKKYPSVKARFLKGLPQGEILDIVTILKDSVGSSEQVFVTVQEISDGMVKGIISSEILNVAGYHRGDKYSFPEEELLDWSITKPDGSEEGNLIGKFIDRIQQNQK